MQYVQLEDVTKAFGEVVALEQFNLGVKKGSAYGLVGVNGSGKTTALKILSGVFKADAGVAKINGVSVGSGHKEIVGYMHEDMYFLPEYTMKMMKGFVADRYRCSWNEKRYAELVEIFGLNEEQVLTTFSRGMQKQAGFILSVSTMPDVLLMDETVDGLDPIVRKQAFKYIIEDVSEREMTVIATSHNMRELDGLCDTVGIIKKGKMLVERDLDDLRTNIHKLQIAFAPGFLAKNFPYDGLDVLHMEEMGSTDILVVRGEESEIAAQIRGFKPLVYDRLPMTLEEIFIYEAEGADLT